MCSTRTPCQQVEARTDSLGAVRTRGRAYVYVYAASHAHSRRASCARARRRAHAHHAVDQPARAVPGNFCCATERPSRNLAYARLANQPGTDVSSTRSTLHRRCAAPHQQRARHTPARTNECTFASLARSLARPRSTERTTVPTTTESSRTEPSRNSKVVESATRASQLLARAQTSTTTAT